MLWCGSWPRGYELEAGEDSQLEDEEEEEEDEEL